MPKRSGKALVVVESPAKARTIAKYLGSGYVVRASVGHVRDLPVSKIGVDYANDFEPEYVVIKDKKKVVAEIRKAAAGAREVFLAPDPDREGEAIAWHLAEEIKGVNTNIKRVLIREITKKGVAAALRTPTVVDTNKAEAQQARRILDRLVGYQISPILWNKVQRGLSAGRVQSVAVRILVEREAAIAGFVPQEYWNVNVDCKAKQPPPFTAKVWRWNGKKAAPKTKEQADAIASELRAGGARVEHIDKKQRLRRPQPPFITSKLQQEASRKLRLTPKRTMALAQRLYEGIELPGEGPVGLITYMRTDSTRVAPDAVGEVREYIESVFGPDYVPNKPNTYKQGKRAQDGHEAIRPTAIQRSPKRIASALAGKRDGKDLARLYELIWRRFVGSQMAPAVYDQTTVTIGCGRAQLRATGRIMRFAGFTKVYVSRESDDARAEKAAEKDKPLPPLEVGDAIELTKVRPEQHFTKPLPRFTEATLVKELELRGIGRPSTYAAILSTILSRGYVIKSAGRFEPTELGTLVNGLLVESFPRVLDIDFTAAMEADLDKVEEGSRNWRELLGEFYAPFSKALVAARIHMRTMRSANGEGGDQASPEHTCERCGSPMVTRRGSKGAFLGCLGYPGCRNTKELVEKPDGTVEIAPTPVTDQVCPDCKAPMVVKLGRFGQFLSCSAYPNCKTTREYRSEV